MKKAKEYAVEFISGFQEIAKTQESMEVKDDKVKHLLARIMKGFLGDYLELVKSRFGSTDRCSLESMKALFMEIDEKWHAFALNVNGRYPKPLIREDGILMLFKRQDPLFFDRVMDAGMPPSVELINMVNKVFSNKQV